MAKPAPEVRLYRHPGGGGYALIPRVDETLPPGFLERLTTTPSPRVLTTATICGRNRSRVSLFFFPPDVTLPLPVALVTSARYGGRVNSLRVYLPRAIRPLLPAGPSRVYGEWLYGHAPFRIHGEPVAGYSLVFEMPGPEGS